MNKNIQRYTPALLLLGAALLIILAREYVTDRTGAGERPPGAPLPGQVVPSFDVRSLADNRIKFPDAYHGKIVLLDFWATWCPPCVAEVPHLVEAYEKYHDAGLEIIGVSLDKGRTSAGTVRSFIQDRHMPWEQIYDEAEGIAGDYRVVGIPTMFLIDGDTGRLLADGNDLYGSALPATIAKHLPNRNP
ncbi:MAG: TlpA disulfide reductase family protein [Phycisphaerae bacterium]|jgi:thiol-disulfide isomerase/thioredoxin